MPTSNARRTLRPPVAALALVLAACVPADGIRPEPPASPVRELLRRFPGAGALLATSRADAVATRHGAAGPSHVIRLPRPAGGAAFGGARAPLAAAVDARGGLLLDLGRSASLRVERLSAPAGGQGGQEELRTDPDADRGVVLARDAHGAVAAATFAAEGGIEDLLVTSEARAVGYRFGLPSAWRLAEARDASGLIEVRDDTGAVRVRVRTGAAWDAVGHEVKAIARISGDTVAWSVDGQPRWPVLVDPLFEPAGALLAPRSEHTSTLLPTGKILVAGGAQGGDASAELIDPATGAVAATGPMTQPRRRHTATLLRSGHVLLIGGVDEKAQAVATAELFDPGTGTFAPAATMGRARSHHTATLLRSGRVLVAGGGDGGFAALFQGQSTSTAEVYDPETNAFAPTGSMAITRWAHVAPLLATGEVLVTAGTQLEGGSFPASDAGMTAAELYDESTGAWSTSGSMKKARHGASATLLPSGQVLVVGGERTLSDRPVEAEVYDRATGTFTIAGSLAHGRVGHTATLLPSGKVLVASGLETTQLTATAEIYDPVVGAFEAPIPLVQPRASHAAALLPTGKVLLSGGHGGPPAQDLGVLFGTYASGASVELFEPADGPIAIKGRMSRARSWHTATLLSDGQVLLAGGKSGLADTTTAELFDPVSGAFVATGSLLHPRDYGTSAILLPSGKVLVTGGGSTAVEIYDPSLRAFAEVGTLAFANYRSATLLADGRVLFAGGLSASGGAAATMLYDPVKGMVPTGALNIPRANHVSIRLLSGKVLVAGGSSPQAAGTAELFDPATGTFTLTGALVEPRRDALGVLLPSSGKALVAGGFTPTGFVAKISAELFDEVTNTFSLTGAMSTPRDAGGITVLASGRVLFTGGRASGQGVQGQKTTDIYNPDTNTFSPGATMATRRIEHTATLLSSGRVMVAGGRTDQQQDKDGFATVELYDPEQDAFGPPPGLSPERKGVTMTLLGSGDVLLAGGNGADVVPTSAELVAPDGASTPTGALARGRWRHAATLLPSGREALITGGYDGYPKGGAPAPVTNTTERYDRTTSVFAPAASMKVARAEHTSTALPSGRILIVGGVGANGDALAAAELYDPATDAFTSTGAMKRARAGHCATLLPSGKVLVAGGVAGGQADTTIEIYDPADGVFRTAAGSFGASACGNLMNGQALLAANGSVARVLGDALAFVIDPGSVEPSGVVPMLDGDAVVAAKGDARVLSNVGSGRPFVDAPLGASVRLASGGFLGYFGGTLRHDPRPRGVVPPTLATVPAAITEGTIVTLTGTRFTRRTAAGIQDATDSPTSFPLVAFMPAAASGGGPLFGATLEWSADHVSWRAPTTAYRGPGFLHAFVDGVWSEGMLTVLRGQGLAKPCERDGECDTDHCSEGICCDRACNGGCESCVASTQGPGGVDGVCKPLAKDAVARFGCEADGTTCGPSGTCDGQRGCTLPGRATTCSLPGGSTGNCVAGACANLTATCDASGYATVGADGVTRPCAPFACRDGACLTTCTTTAACAPGNRCNAQGRCEAASPLGEAPDPGACAASASARGHARGLVAIALALGAAALRRRRRPAA